jgi:receptor expression-enhancing protein 1/2/3/4
VLFPIFASYKALRTSDPAQLTPWLMYWVILSLVFTTESMLWFVLSWIPFYSWFRLFLHLYLVLPGKQGATHLYQEYIHPFLADHENDIDTFISDAHEKAKAAGLQYLKQAVEWIKVNVMGMQPRPPTPPTSRQGSYAQQLFSRFNLPSAREGLAAPAGDFVGLLASALQYTTATGGTREAQAQDLSESGTLIPPEISSNAERMTYISAQRERLRVLLSAFDREAYNLASAPPEPALMTREKSNDGGLSKSRSEADFDKIEKEEVPAGKQAQGGWMPWNWSRSNTATEEWAHDKEESKPEGQSSGVDMGH